MTEAVFTPLGMTSSSYVRRPEFDALTATGHDTDGKPVSLWKPNEAGAASTLNTTAEDYALFVRAILGGKGLKRATLHEMETRQIALDPECRICVKREPKQLSERCIVALGDNGAFKCFVMAEPRTKSGVVMFTNSQNGLEIAEPLIDEAMGADALAFAWLK